MRLTIGRPFTLPEVQGRVTQELLQEMADTIMDRIAVLVPEDYRGYYADRARALETAGSTL